MGFSAIAAIAVFASAAGGFFRPEKVGGVWHLARQGEDPVRILSTSHIGFGGTADASGERPQESRNKAKYASREKWAETTLSRLREWGFNTVGNPVREFKGREMPYFRYIQFTPRFMLEDMKDEDRWILGPMKKGTRKRFPNVFSPKWEEFCRNEAKRCATKHLEDRNLIGYFTDNELRWFGDDVTNHVSGLFDLCIAKKNGHSAKAAAIGFLAERGLAATNEIPVAVKREFLRLIAEKYYSTVSAAIRAADPNHLVLGSRLHVLGRDGVGTDLLVVEACGRHCDVVSVNCYPWVDLENGVVWGCDSSMDGAVKMEDRWREICARAGKPVFVSEWSFVATDSGLPCTKGAGQVFATQAERVKAAEANARLMLSEPGLIGYNFFKWCDDPPPAKNVKRRAENKNYGLVSIDDEPYAGLTGMFRRLHGECAKKAKTNCK